MSRLYGLIGFPLGHSFSKRYFSEKFLREQIQDARYELFAIEEIGLLEPLIDNHPDLKGLNVTIPYKAAVIPYLDALDTTAKAVGAVNCIQISEERRLTGYNTDVVGFEKSLTQLENGRWISPEIPVFILGNGGAAKAVRFVVENMGKASFTVSRNAADLDAAQWILWTDLEKVFTSYADQPIIIVNTTPLGMAPLVDQYPPLPFDCLGPKHLVYDLVYNPEETLLLRIAIARGCSVKNGLEMLHEQAEAAWQIWQS